MSDKYQVPRGTQDILEDSVIWQKVEGIIREECDRYGYSEIRTPIFEHTEVFRTENDSSDMVTKEMYSFTDNGDRSLTLRPEGTKGVIRAFVEHKLYGNPAELPKKLYYMGPMFRYERPQKGRYRQFHQFGIEAIGAKSPLLDVEGIALGYSIVGRLGLKRVKVLVNTLGDTESRNAYRAALKDYFRPHLSELCADCQRRFDLNPLRILDCKIDKGSPLFEKVPVIGDYLNDASRAYFAEVLEGLRTLEIPYEVNDKLVRGLDYYSNTVFEAVPLDDDSAQATLFAGGQYDGLVEYYGGGNLPGFGFGMGLERMISLARETGSLELEDRKLDAYVISLGNVGTYALDITQKLRGAGYTADTDYMKRSLKAQFKATDRLKARAVIIVGEDEKNAGMLQLKDTENKTQITIKYEDLLSEIGKIL